MSQSGQPAINAATHLCAVLGCPIAHSASPAMHNAAFKALGLNWRYLAFEVDPKNLRAAIEGARAMNFAGLNLTVPHKLLAVEMVDELDDSAKMFGAVNTIKFETARGRTQGKVRAVGFNTDADAIAISLREELKMKLCDARVVLLGAGGAGRTAALKLASENVSELFLINRTASKAEELAREIRKRFSSVKVFVGYPPHEPLGKKLAQGGGLSKYSSRPLASPSPGGEGRGEGELSSAEARGSNQSVRKGGWPKIDLVLNATSLGLKANDPSPLDEKQFSLRQTHAVYDMIYRPAETRLLAAARKAGCKTANGLGMLLHQGAKAFKIWTGKTAPVAIMRSALKSIVHSPRSSVQRPNAER